MSFSHRLLTWYQTEKRALPWRETKDPYSIWLSEVILQQTRVDQGLQYYLAFVESYPTVHDLANANEEEVLKLWQGLGYYSRARNLHATAKRIANELRGVFPSTYSDLIQLKGIGPYTAAAIASICFNAPHPVIDGNVYRVLSRVFGIRTPIDSKTGIDEFHQLANSLLDAKQAGEYNQAIMEFGALQCKPKNPDCRSCPINEMCIARSTDSIDQLPVKSKKTKVRNRYFNYLVIRTENELLLNKRTQNDIWKNLYDFPLIESDKKLPKSKLIASEQWKNLINNTPYTIVSTTKPTKHVLSHQHIHATFWELAVANFERIDTSKLTTIKSNELSRYPVPRLIENYCKQ
jgi:A/G-specific adenine glycosylase